MMWGLLQKTLKNNNQDDISFMDVKALYDAAYEEKAKARVNLKKFTALMEKATQLDLAYREQLAAAQAQPFRYTKTGSAVQYG